MPKLRWPGQTGVGRRGHHSESSAPAEQKRRRQGRQDREEDGGEEEEKRREGTARNQEQTRPAPHNRAGRWPLARSRKVPRVASPGNHSGSLGRALGHFLFEHCVGLIGQRDSCAPSCPRAKTTRALHLAFARRFSHAPSGP